MRLSQSPYLQHGEFPDFFGGPRCTLLETYFMDALVNVDAVFSGHYLADDRTALILTILLCGSHSARTTWETQSVNIC